MRVGVATSGAHALGGPVLPQAGHPIAVQFEDRDFTHAFAVTVDDVVEAGFPLRDGGGAVGVQVEQFGLNIRLLLDDFASASIREFRRGRGWAPAVPARDRSRWG